MITGPDAEERTMIPDWRNLLRLSMTCPCPLLPSNTDGNMWGTRRPNRRKSRKLEKRGSGIPSIASSTSTFSSILFFKKKLKAGRKKEERQNVEIGKNSSLKRVCISWTEPQNNRLKENRTRGGPEK